MNKINFLKIKLYKNHKVSLFYRNSAQVSCYEHPDAPLIEDYRAGDQICSQCGLVVGDRYVKFLTFKNLI